MPSLAAAANRTLPVADEIHVETVGTSATTATDLWSLFGGLDTARRRPMRITIQADGVIGVLAGPDDTVAAPDLSAVSPAAGQCKRVPADVELSVVANDARRWIRLIAESAGTRVEITLG